MSRKITKKYDTTIDIIRRNKDLNIDKIAKYCKVKPETVINWCKGESKTLSHANFMYLCEILEIPRDIQDLFKQAIWNDAKIVVRSGRSNPGYRNNLFACLGIIELDKTTLDLIGKPIKEDKKVSYLPKIINGTRVLSAKEVIDGIYTEMDDSTDERFDIDNVWIVKATLDDYGLKANKIVDCKLDTLLRLVGDPNVVFLMPFKEKIYENE